MSRFYACMSDNVRRTCVKPRLSILYLISLILLLLIQLPSFTHTAYAQTTYNEPYGLIELSEIPTPDQRTELSDAGITLLDYLYGSTWTASFDNSIDLTQIEMIVSVKELNPSAKVSSSFETLSGFATSESVNQIDVRVRLWEEDTSGYLEQYGTVITQDWMFTVVRINETDINTLANDPNIRWIEPVFPLTLSTDEPLLSVETTDPHNHLVPDNPSMTEVTVGVFDTGRIVPISRFANNLTYLETFTIPITSTSTQVTYLDAIDASKKYATHATKVASMVNSTDATAHLNSYHYKDQSPLRNNEVDISNASVAVKYCPETGKYTGISQQFDSYDSIIIFAAGNNRDLCTPFNPNYEDIAWTYTYGTIPLARQSAKNPITVGAIDFRKDITDFSATGPTQDGRIAPTFVHYGKDVQTYCPDGNLCPDDDDGTNNGTSFSAPTVAGIASLVLKAYRASTGDNTASLSSADIRALLAATAEDLGRVGPDYEYGFGFVDAQRAIDALPNLNHYETEGVDGAYNDTVIPVDSTTEELNVVLAWNDIPFDPVVSGLPPFITTTDGTFTTDGFTQTVLINDLDLKVTAPDGTEHYPFTLNPDAPRRIASPGVDQINTTEQVVIDNPQAGDWAISVTHNGRIITDNAHPTQKYTVVYATTPTDSSTPLSITLSPLSTTSPNLSFTLITVFMLLIGTQWTRRQSCERHD